MIQRGPHKYVKNHPGLLNNSCQSFTFKAKKHVILSWKSLKRRQPSLAAALGGRTCLKSVRRAEKLQNELPGWRTMEPRSRMNLCSADPFRDANVHPANVSTISLRPEAPSVIELWRVIGLRRQATVRLMGPSGIYAFGPRRILPDDSGAQGVPAVMNENIEPRPF